MTAPTQRLLTTFFGSPLVKKRKDPEKAEAENAQSPQAKASRQSALAFQAKTEEESIQDSQVKTLNGRKPLAPEKAAVQKLSVHHIRLSSVCFKDNSSPSLNEIIMKIIEIYNEKKTEEAKYKEISGLRPIEESKSFSFNLRAFAQVSPIKSKLYSLLASMGGSNLETAKKVNYVFFLYRSQTIADVSQQDLFALTVSDGWHVIQPFFDYTFPKKIAIRLLNPKKIGEIEERFLVGENLRSNRILRTFAINDETGLDSFIKTMRCQLRDAASIFALTCFQDKKTRRPIPTNLEIGLGKVRICTSLPLDAYPGICDHFSKIVRSQHTYSYSLQPENEKNQEIDERGFDFLNYFVPVASPSKIVELKNNLLEAIWDAFYYEKDLQLDFQHKRSSDYSQSSSFSLKYNGTGGSFTLNWSVRRSATEILQSIKKHSPFLAVASKKDFFKDLANVKISFATSRGTETAPFMEYLEGLVRDKEGLPFWRLWKMWYSVSQDYLTVVHKQFHEFVIEASLKSGFLPEKWPSPKEVAAQKKSNDSKRDETENKYNQQYLDKPLWIVGDKICPEGIELFDLLHFPPNGIYVVHVKHGLGTSTRAACSQIRLSAKYIHDALYRQSSTNKLKLFYQLAINSSLKKDDDYTYRLKAREKILKEFPKEQMFVDRFITRERPITFVFAFADDAEGLRYLKNDKNLKKLITDNKKVSVGMIKNLETKGFIDSNGNLTELSQSITQDDFIKSFSPLCGTKAQLKEVHKLIRECRSLSDTSQSTIARIEVLHTKKELAKLGFELKICQIDRTDYVSSDFLPKNVLDTKEDSPFVPESLFSGSEWTNLGIEASFFEETDEDLKIQASESAFFLPQQISLSLIPGQPLQLVNDGSSCFINASFWAIMAVPAFKNALLQSCREQYMMNDLSHKNEAINQIIEAVNIYDTERSSTTPKLNLSKLRSLLPETQRRGQQDSVDMFRSLFNLIDVEKHPKLFFPLSMEQTYTPYKPGTNMSMAVEITKRIQKYKEKEDDVTIMPKDNQITQPPQPNYELSVPMPKDLVSGQVLFNQCFQFDQRKDHEPMVYKDQETGKLKAFQITGERFCLKSIPDQFVFTLKRFYNVGVKDDRSIFMPELLKLNEHLYEVVAIVQHKGSFNGGHYLTLTKNNETWWVCDDQRDSILPATQHELDQALEKGYSYIYIKKPS